MYTLGDYGRTHIEYGNKKTMHRHLEKKMVHHQNILQRHLKGFHDGLDAAAAAAFRTMTAHFATQTRDVAVRLVRSGLQQRRQTEQKRQHLAAFSVVVMQRRWEPVDCDFCNFSYSAGGGEQRPAKAMRDSSLSEDNCVLTNTSSMSWGHVE